MNLSEFFHMGGYAFYVWTSYSLAFVVLLTIFVAPILHRNKLKADFNRKARRAKREKP